MSTLTAHFRHLFAAVVAFGLLAVGATDAQATHFRYGTLRWEKTSETANDITIRVTTESAWRCTFYAASGCSALPATVNTTYSVIVQRVFNNQQLFSAPLSVFRTSTNNAEDWFAGNSTIFPITIPKAALANGGVRIYWASNARISTLQDGNADDPFRVEAIMSETPNQASPAASILPIITVGYPLPAATFFIPAVDVEGDTLTWRISEVSRSSLTKAAPDGFDDVPGNEFRINSATGEVTWNTGQEWAPGTTPTGTDLYAVQFIVRDSKGAETPVDALLRLVNISGATPQVLLNNLPTPLAIDVRPNNPVTFVVTGTDADAGATVTLTSGPLPPGAVMTPSLPTAGLAPRSSTFTWTPTLAQAGNTFPVSFAATDNLGMQDTNSASIRVLENFPPVATCPAPLTLEATSAAGGSATLNTTVSDPDGDALTVNWSVNGTVVETDTVPAGAGSTVVSLTRSYGFLPSPHAIAVQVSDALLVGNCSTSVTVVDTTPPVVQVPGNITQEATAPAGNAVTFAATATDIVDPNPTVACVPASGSTFAVNGPAPSATTVTCTATDSSSNSASATFTVRIQDTTPPVISNMPADMIVEATGPSGAAASWPSPTALDIVDLVRPVDCVPASGSTFALGVTTVTCSASDTRGNSSSASFTVTVQDTTAPVLSLPANMVEEATQPAGDIVTYTATATDIVDPSPTVVCAPASGSVFGINGPSPDATTVTCTATDAANNSSTGTFTVRVQDTTPPVISGMPADFTVEATSPAGASASWTSPTALDIVDLGRPVTCTPAAGSTFPLGASIVTCTSSDTRGNTSSAQFTVTVQDTTPPVVTVPATITVEATGPSGAVATFTATAEDIVSGTLTPTCTPASGSTFPVGSSTVVCTATDAAGNTGSASFTVNVVDTGAPVVTVPANMTLEGTSPAGAVATFTATAFDIVDGPIVPVCTPASGSTFAMGPTVVTCTATDTAGNTGSASFTITVVDTTPPVISGMPGNLVQEATSPAGAAASWSSPIATDIVDTDVPVTCAPVSGSTFAIAAPGPVTTVTCTATDDAGNSTSAAFTVTVVDTTPPVISNMPGPIALPANLPGGAVATWPSPTALDIVDLVVPVTCSPASGSVFPVGNTIVTCSASDTRGNTSSDTFTVTVNLAPPPVFTISLNPGLLWPPNHKMVDIRVTVSPTQPSGVTCSIAQVTSNQPQNGTGDGDTDIDWIFQGMRLQLRAERAGNMHRGIGRIYTVTVGCTSQSGATSYSSATANVPHDMRGGR